jgi:hypothetical protein
MDVSPDPVQPLAPVQPAPRSFEDSRMGTSHPLSFRATDRAFAVITWGIFALSFAKGFRFPGLWTATHFTFNYSHGFVRRGLVGELARRIAGNGVYKYNVFLAFSFLILASVGALMALAIGRVLRWRPNDWSFRTVLLIVCASPGAVFLVHAVGYFDFFGLLALLGVLFWANERRSRSSIFFLLAFLGLVLALVHEGLVVMFGPCALFIALCQWIRTFQGREPSTRDWALFATGSLLIVLLIVSFVVAVCGPTDVARMEALRQFASHHADFALRPDAFAVLTQSTYRNVTVVVPGFWGMAEERSTALNGQVAFMPGFLFALFCGVRDLLAISLPRAQRAALLILFLAGGITPELMNIVGWDWPRWDSMALMTCLICTVTYKTFFPYSKRASSSLSLVTIGLLLTSAGLASTTLLFDNYRTQAFPFLQQIDFANQVLDSRFRWKPIN